MVVNVVNGGELMHNALLYRPPDNSIVDYFSNKLNHVIQYTQGLSNQFIDTTKKLYDKVYDSKVIERTKALLSMSDYALSNDVITLVPYGHMSNANMVMQQYIMAYPEVQDLVKRNKCHGYQDTYFNIEPDTYGEDRYEYQRVMDGVLQFEDTEEGEGYLKHYINSDEIELTTHEKLSVLDTWHNVSRMIAEGLDPTE